MLRHKENIAAEGQAGIRAYTALPESEKRTSLFTMEDFVYERSSVLHETPVATECIWAWRGCSKRPGHKSVLILRMSSSVCYPGWELSAGLQS
jgi:hypothetical protein